MAQETHGGEHGVPGQNPKEDLGTIFVTLHHDEGVYLCADEQTNNSQRARKHGRYRLACQVTQGEGDQHQADCPNVPQCVVVILYSADLIHDISFALCALIQNGKSAKTFTYYYTTIYSILSIAHISIYILKIYLYMQGYSQSRKPNNLAHYKKETT